MSHKETAESYKQEGSPLSALVFTSCFLSRLTPLNLRIPKRAQCHVVAACEDHVFHHSTGISRMFKYLCIYLSRCLYSLLPFLHSYFILISLLSCLSPFPLFFLQLDTIHHATSQTGFSDYFSVSTSNHRNTFLCWKQLEKAKKKKKNSASSYDAVATPLVLFLEAPLYHNVLTCCQSQVEQYKERGGGYACGGGQGGWMPNTGISPMRPGFVFRVKSKVN